VFNKRNVRAEDVTFRKGTGVVKFLVLIKVKNTEELSEIIKDLKNIKGISSVHRNLPVKRIC
jgi:(p)ppGpp synthase/HD superfamily hydrolase